MPCDAINDLGWNGMMSMRENC